MVAAAIDPSARRRTSLEERLGFLGGLDTDRTRENEVIECEWFHLPAKR
jgi:hypothetical protein